MLPDPVASPDRARSTPTFFVALAQNVVVVGGKVETGSSRASSRSSSTFASVFTSVSQRQPTPTLLAIKTPPHCVSLLITKLCRLRLHRLPGLAMGPC